MSARMAKFIRASASSPVALLIFQATVNTVVGSPVAESPAVSTNLIVDPEEIRSQATPQPFLIHDEWTDWETWEASPDIIKAFPYRKVGHDLDGLPVYLIEFGKWDYRELSKKPKEKLDEFWKYFEQFIRRHEKDAGLNIGAGVADIVDYDGFSLSHHASGTAIKLVMKMFAGLVRLNSFMKYGLYVNVNFGAETFINAMRPFMAEHLAKVDMGGPEWRNASRAY